MGCHGKLKNKRRVGGRTFRGIKQIIFRAPDCGDCTRKFHTSRLLQTVLKGGNKLWSSKERQTTSGRHGKVIARGVSTATQLQGHIPTWRARRTGTSLCIRQISSYVVCLKHPYPFRKHWMASPFKLPIGRFPVLPKIPKLPITPDRSREDRSTSAHHPDIQAPYCNLGDEKREVSWCGQIRHEH